MARSCDHALPCSRLLGSNGCRDIHALDIYILKSYGLMGVDAADLARRGDQVAADCHAARAEAEDAAAMALTVLRQLARRHGICAAEVGMLQMVTGSLLDRSKSLKTALASQLDAHGIAASEGVDTVGAGGVRTLLSCVCWSEAAAWDGRWAVMVSANAADERAGQILFELLC